VTGRRWVLAAVTAGAAVAIGLAVAGVLFSSAQGTAAIADDATVEVRAEQVLSAASVSRSLVSEALILDQTGTAGPVTTGDNVSNETAHSSLEDLRYRVAALTTMIPDAGTEIRDASIAMLDSGDDLLADLEQSPGAALPADTIDAFATGYAQLVDAVTAERDARAEHVAAVRQGAASIANSARFLVAFIVPCLAILGFVVVERRRRARLELGIELEQEQELRAARDEFLASVAHELRTPLTAVVGFAEILREGRTTLNTGERSELIEILADRAQDTGAIVENLLTLSRATLGILSVRSQPVDARDVIDELVLGWNRQDRAQVSVTGTATVMSDPDHLRQMLRCLLGNAIQHGGGCVEVRISQGIPTARIEIVDDGPGVPPEHQHDIFEPYRRASQTPGQPARIGLGLTVARTMAGDLTYRNRRGESIFELTLPSAGAGRLEAGETDTVIDLPVGSPSLANVLDAIRDGSFDVVFQPIVDLTRQDGTTPVIGYEALSRFPFGDPYQWFSVADDSGLRLKLELAAIAKAIEAFRHAPDDTFLTLNVSAETLGSSRLIETLDGAPSRRIILELTEDAIIRSYESTRETLATLSNKGFRVAVDDMGTGQTDLWHLIRLHPDVVKLDLSLIRDIDTDPDKQALVTGLTWLCKGLGAAVVAEGVESPGEDACVVRLGVHWGQGYLYGRPTVAGWERGAPLAVARRGERHPPV
jgi:EAL domain-containing protein (putative c-di-GMP-specific phosphodiesterase class I)/signal transduction histidine kinase